MKFRSMATRVALALLLAMSLGRLMGAEAPPLDHVTLQLKWKHQFQFAGYYAAVAKGFYREAGLDVSLVEANPAHDPTEEVLAGHADFGVGNSDLVVFRAKGKPVVVLAAIFQHSPLVLVVRAASGSTTNAS
jgi:ABC-type nitrate/sulfonate/bicarbonate transport system substrate-binding protein